MLYGTILSLLVLALARLTGRFPGWHLLPFLVLTLSFVFLTQHPFPAPGTLNCPVATATPQLAPLAFLENIRLMNRLDASVWGYLSNKALAASAMNFLICAGIGLLLVRHIRTWMGIALFGALLTLTVELTQLTGIWGLYPCAYRQFNVDDLLLNMLGVLAGAAFARLTARRQTA